MRAQSTRPAAPCERRTVMSGGCGGRAHRRMGEVTWQYADKPSAWWRLGLLALVELLSMRVRQRKPCARGECASRCSCASVGGTGASWCLHHTCGHCRSRHSTHAGAAVGCCERGGGGLMGLLDQDACAWRARTSGIACLVWRMHGTHRTRRDKSASTAEATCCSGCTDLRLKRRRGVQGSSASAPGKICLDRFVG